MTDLYRANLEIAKQMIEHSQKSQTVILEEDPQKLALQIDNDIRESLPPQMMSVVSAVLNLLRDLDVNEPKL